MTGYGDIATAVASVKAGAHDFLEKPFDEERLRESISAAVAQTDETHEADDYLTADPGEGCRAARTPASGHVACSTRLHQQGNCETNGYQLSVPLRVIAHW